MVFTLRKMVTVMVTLRVLVACSGDAEAEAEADSADASAGDDGSDTDDDESDTGAGDGDGNGDGDGDGDGEFEGDLDMTPDDFACVQDWPKVRAFHITNLLGYEAEALAVANSPNGGTYPPGTVIQLIPTEAMVKREAGWSPETNDWEFFALGVDASGTTIDARGKTEVVNAFNGNCFDCHAKAEPQWDLICEDTHGCDPIPIGDDVIEMLQDGDPRCP